MIRTIAIFSVAVLILGCTAAHRQESLLRSVPLSEGMPRADAERLIAQATGRKSTYDLYAMDTSSEVRYRDGGAVLVVRYKPGAPAPLFTGTNGQTQDLPPIDGEVISWTWETE